MGLKSLLSLPFAKQIVKKNRKWKKNAVKVQNALLLSLVNKAKNTKFGKDHKFSEILNYSDWKKNIPVRDYEELKIYVQEIIEGKKMCFGQGDLFIFVKLQEQLQEQNIFQSAKKVCLTTLLLLVMQY